MVNCSEIDNEVSLIPTRIQQFFQTLPIQNPGATLERISGTENFINVNSTSTPRDSLMSLFKLLILMN